MSNTKQYRLTNPLQYRKGFRIGRVYPGYELNGLIWLNFMGDEHRFHPEEVTEVQL